VAGRLRRERVQRPVAVGQEDLRTAPQPQPVGELVGGLVKIAVLAWRQFDRGAAGRRPLRLADDDQRRDQEQQADQRAAHRVRPAGVVQPLGEERQGGRGLQDQGDDDHVEYDHEDEERHLCRVP
jgi:hypothetical protein